MVTGQWLSRVCQTLATRSATTHAIWRPLQCAVVLCLKVCIQNIACSGGTNVVGARRPSPANVTVLQGMHISAQHFAHYDDSYTCQKASSCCQSTCLFTVGMYPRSEHVGPRPFQNFPHSHAAQDAGPQCLYSHGNNRHNYRYPIPSESGILQARKHNQPTAAAAIAQEPTQWHTT